MAIDMSAKKVGIAIKKSDIARLSTGGGGPPPLPV
jgi:hypothetical protein